MSASAVSALHRGVYFVKVAVESVCKCRGFLLTVTKAGAGERYLTQILVSCPVSAYGIEIFAERAYILVENDGFDCHQRINYVGQTENEEVIVSILRAVHREITLFF